MNEKQLFLVLTNSAIKWYDIFIGRSLTSEEAKEFIEDCTIDGITYHEEIITIITTMHDLELKLNVAKTLKDDKKEGDDNEIDN